MKILISEDEITLLSILKDEFADEGFDVLTSKNGKEAIEILKSEKGKEINLLILDLLMPIMDGFAVLEEMGRNGKGCKA